jgi:hypothetical protein
MQVAVAAAVFVSVLVSTFFVLSSWHVVPGFRGCSLLRTYDGRVDCYASVISSRADQSSLAEALRWTDTELASASQGMKDDCHQGAHKIGKDLAKTEAGRSRIVTVRDIAGRCSSAVTHELLRWIVKAGGGTATLQQVRAVCPSTTNRGFSLCIHAMGHAYVLNGRKQTFTRDCKDLFSAEYQVFNCEFGGFMELGIKYPDVRPESKICSVPDSPAPYACYGQVAGLLMEHDERGYDHRGLVRYCDRLGDVDARRGCVVTASDYADAKAGDTRNCATPTAAEIRIACGYGILMRQLGLLESPSNDAQDKVPEDWPERRCDSEAEFEEQREACAAAWGHHLYTMAPLDAPVARRECARRSFDRGMQDACIAAADGCWPFQSFATCSERAAASNRRKV